MKQFYFFSFILCLFATTNSQAEDRPNFVLILADDMGYSDLHCYGHPSYQTPQLDALAAAGVRCTNFHSNGSVCSPTRAALMTGKYQQRAGISGIVTALYHRHTGLGSDQTTFAQLLKQHGYQTALFGKWHLGYATEYNPIQRGFDRFNGFVGGEIDYFSHIDFSGKQDWWIQDRLKDETGYATTTITQHSLKFITQNKDRPFCLFVSQPAPHSPYQGPKDKGYRTVGNSEPLLGIVEDKARARRQMVEYLDHQIGMIQQKLEEHNLQNKTLFIFCSDNGSTAAFGGSNLPYRGAKKDLYEGGHRVPAIFYWPNQIKPAVTDAPIMTMDLMPTMLTLAGIKLPNDLDGIDLSQHLLEEKPIPKNRPMFWEFKKNLAVRRGNWKFIQIATGETELYDLEKDPSEKNNVAEKNTKVAVELKRLVHTWYEEVSQGVEVRAE